MSQQERSIIEVQLSKHSNEPKREEDWGTELKSEATGVLKSSTCGSFE